MERVTKIQRASFKRLSKTEVKVADINWPIKRTIGEWVARSLHLEPSDRTIDIIKHLFKPDTKIKALLQTDHKMLKVSGDKKIACAQLNAIQDHLASKLVAELDQRLCDSHAATCILCHKSQLDIGKHFCQQCQVCRTYSSTSTKKHTCSIPKMQTFNVMSDADDFKMIDDFFDGIHLCECGECAGPCTVRCQFCRPKSTMIPETLPCRDCNHMLTHLDSLDFMVGDIDGTYTKKPMTSLPVDTPFHVRCQQCSIIADKQDKARRKKKDTKNVETCVTCHRQHYTTTSTKLKPGSDECNDCISKANRATTISCVQLLAIDFGKTCVMCAVVAKHVEGDHIDVLSKIGQSGSVGRMLRNGSSYAEILSEQSKCRPLCRMCHKFVTHVQRSSGIINFKNHKLCKLEYATMLMMRADRQRIIEQRFVSVKSKKLAEPTKNNMLGGQAVYTSNK